MRIINNHLNALSEFSFLSYLGGLFDGEGYFVVAIQKHKKMLLDFQIMPNIGLTLVMVDGLEVLQNIQSRLNIGTLFCRQRTDKNRRQIIEWRIRTFDEVKKFVDIVEPHLIIKHETLLKFKEIINLCESGHHSTVDGFLDICMLRDQLNERKKSPNYRDYAFFKKYFKQHPPIEQNRITSTKRNTAMWYKK